MFYSKIGSHNLVQKFSIIFSFFILTCFLHSCYVYQDFTDYNGLQSKTNADTWTIESQLLPKEKNYWLPPTFLFHKQHNTYSIHIGISGEQLNPDSVILNRIDLMTDQKTIFSTTQKGCIKHEEGSSFVFESEFFEMKQNTDNLTLIVQVQFLSTDPKQKQKSVRKIKYTKDEHLGWVKYKEVK